MHDYFLGRHNCQSFIRKYFVVAKDAKESDPNYHCVRSVLEAYKRRPGAEKRFAYSDEHGKWWYPIIPDVTMTKPIEFIKLNGKPTYIEENKLPTYDLRKLPAGQVEKKFGRLIAARYRAVANNLLPVTGFWRFVIKLASRFSRGRITDFVTEKINKDFRERGLID